MTDYASMRALDIWYDRIDLDRVLKVLPSGEEVERVRQRVEQARRKSLPDSLFPKLVEHLGSAPRIKDEPPLIFHPSEKQAPGVTSDMPTRSKALSDQMVAGTSTRGRLGP
jgi:hypothetical protein